MDDDKMSSSASNTGNKVSGIKREKPATRSSRNSTKIDDNDKKSEVITDDDKTEENLEIDTTRSGASSKTVENLNTPLKCKSSLVKGIDEMSDDEKISKWLEKHPANDSLNNFSSISSYEDIISSPKRKIAEDFDSAYSDNDSDNVQNSKKPKFEAIERTNSTSGDKSETVKSGCDEGLVEDEVSKDDATINNLKHSNTSSPLSSCTNTAKSVTGKSVSGKKIDIRNHKAFKMMQEYHSSISKFSSNLRKNPPVKTSDKPKEVDREKRKSPELKRTTRSISLIEPKSPHQERSRRSIDSKKCNELRTKSRQSSVASDRTFKSKRSRSKSIPPDKSNSLVEDVNNVPPSMPIIITDRSKLLYDNDELLNLLEGCDPVDEKPLKFDGSIIDITNDDNDFIVVENDKAAADDIEIIEIDRDEKFAVSSANLEIEIIDMTAELNETSPKTEMIEAEVTEQVCENSPTSVPEAIEKTETVEETMDHNALNVAIVTEELVVTANNTRNSSVIVDSRAITTPETTRNNEPPLILPMNDTEPIEREPSPVPSNLIKHRESPINTPSNDVRTTSAIRVRDATSLGAAEPLSDEDVDAAAILNNEVFKSLIDTCYLFCSWYTLLEKNVQFNGVLKTEVGKMFHRDLSLVLFDQLKNAILRSTYEQLKSSINNLLLYTKECKQLLFKTMYSKVREMCNETNSLMIPTNQPWIEDIFTQCIDKFKAETFVMESQVSVSPEMVERVVVNPVPPPQHNPQYIGRTVTTESSRIANPGIIRAVNPELLRMVSHEMIRPVNSEVIRGAHSEIAQPFNHELNRSINTGLRRPVPVSIASPTVNHPISSPRQNVIEINKSATANPVQSLKDIRINNVNYHAGGPVNGPPNVNISMLHQKSVPEAQYNRRPVELLSHLINNTSLSRAPVQHNSKSPQQTPNLQYPPAYSNATKPLNPPGGYMPNNNIDQRFTVTASNTYYPPLAANRANQPPPYPNYGNYDSGPYSHIQQQQYLNYQNHMRANHQQKQTTSQGINVPPNSINSPYSSILRSSLQPASQIQAKPNTLNVHYHNSYIQGQHGQLQHNQQSGPQYQRSPGQSMVNATSNHPSQVRNHLRSHIEMSTPQQQQQQQHQQQHHQQQHQHHIMQQQQQQQPNNLQKKSPQQSPQMQGSTGHSLQRPVAAYEIVPVPSSDTQFQLRLANDLSSQAQHQPVPTANQVTSTQERISPDSQTTRETHSNTVGVGHSNGGGGNAGGLGGDSGSNQQNASELSTIVKTLVRESLREYLPQMQQANLTETKKMVARNIHNNSRNK